MAYNVAALAPLRGAGVFFFVIRWLRSFLAYRPATRCYPFGMEDARQM